MTEPDARLVESASSPAPGGGTVNTIALSGGVRLRTARWVKTPCRGTVLICTGRSEFIEKYLEVVRNLLDRDLSVVVFDWRGQGLSTRALRDRLKGHVASFDLYLDDLDAVIAQVLQPFCPPPFFALAHSMGGTVLALHAARGESPFERLAFSAPMLEVQSLPLPGSLGRITGGLTRLGFGGFFVPRGQRADVFERGFADNVLTSDPGRFATMMSFVQAEPALALGPPTIGWLAAAFVAMETLANPDVCRRIQVPSLLVVPGADRVVSVPAMQRFVQRLRACTPVLVPHARHEILMERDPLRDQVWAAFDAFVPGKPAAPFVQREMLS